MRVLLNSTRHLSANALISIAFALIPGCCVAQRWVNPCASSSSVSTQETALNNGTNSTDVCSFLDRTYEEVDSRCGISLVGRLWPPDKWFHSRHPYDVVPDEVIQDIPREAFDASNWTELSIPSLARLTTTGILVSSGGAEPSDDAGIQATQALSNSPNTLHFNPLIDPQIMFDTGNSRSLHTVTCTNALSASESGSLTIPIATASEKFSAQENSSLQTELTYGTFVSPMTYFAETYPKSFLFETLDFYQRYQDEMDAALPGSTTVYYLKGVEGVIVYDTVKKALSSDVSGSVNVNYAVPLGGVSASATGEQDYQGNNTAYLFHALVRKATWAKLPTLADTLASLNKIGTNLISESSTYAKQAAFDKTSGSVEASFVIENLPSSLCSKNLWTVNGAVPSDIQLSSIFESSAAQVNAAATPATATSDSAKSPSACVWTVSTKMPNGVGADITGNLSLILDTGSTLKTITFDFPYTLSVPKLQLMAATSTAATTTVDFWYQVPKPSLLDATVLPSSRPPDRLKCGGTVINSPTGTVALASTYTSPGGGAAVTGTFYDVQYQWKAPNPTDVNAACNPGGSVSVVLQSGAPTIITLPISTGP